MAEMEWAEGGDIQHGDNIFLSSLFVHGSNASPRKADHFRDKAKETEGSTTLPPASAAYGIKRDRSISVEEMDDQFLLSRVKRGLKASREGSGHLSSRKVGELFVDIPEDQMESPLSTPRTATQKNILVHVSPRVIRTQSEDGSSELEFQLSTPIVRHSKSLALRRSTSVVYNSPQFQVTTPLSARQRYSYENKPSPLERLKSEDRMSEGSSLGQESMSIDSDDDVGRLDSIGDELEPRETVKHGVTSSHFFTKPSDRTWPMTTRRLPFCLKRQESDLFENDPPVTANDIAFLQGDDSSNDFKLGRRRNGKSSVEREANSERNTNNLASKEKDPTQTLPRWGRSMPAVENYPQQQLRIKTAVETFCRYDSQVIADGTALYALPCFRGKKEELMFITSHTLADVLEGRYDNVLDHFDIIDCRYPYEYAGGHIIGALNMFRAENIGEIMSWKDNNSNKRNVLIFHCEFSSQRGPAMMRLLRNTDRRHNADCYPYLCHPEIYLLEGGYKEFYAKYPHLCEPQNYVPMVHADHASDMKKFLARSTSWHGKDIRFSKHSHTLLI